ncbi:excisionase [Sansalvadorimonas verongulae]|uniref:excisionase n=1 Tax=Sansalvadorimonas verongulae TaxID=2172824 RepID=UPI0012BD491F|nr:excisionase [Sansalvadorimonas verongulae]MTI15119.1 excisionase [Sansalvadorimonas verongulae]
MLKWVKATRYFELSGDTRSAFDHKRKRGIWREEREFRKAADGVYWVNLEAVELWAAKSLASKG